MDEILDGLGKVIPPKYQPLLFILPIFGRMYHALANGAGIVGAAKGVLFGTNTPKAPQTPPAAPGGAKTGIVMLLATSLLLASAGCAGEPAVVYKSVSTAQISVETAMTAYSDYLQQHPLPDATRAKVKALYERYQLAAVAVVDAQRYIGTLTATNSPPAPTSAVTAAKEAQSAALSQAGQALSDLVAFLTSVGIKF